MEQEKKITELENRIKALENPKFLNQDLVRLLVADGFLQSELELLFTSGANVDFINLLVNGKNGVREYVIEAQPAGYFKEFSVNVATDKVICQNHGLSDGAQIWVMSTGVLPAGMGSGAVPLFVNDSTTDTFEVNLPFGTPINLTNAGTGVHYWRYYT